MTDVQPKQVGNKISFWETRAQARNDRFYTDKVPLNDKPIDGADSSEKKVTNDIVVDTVQSTGNVAAESAGQTVTDATKSSADAPAENVLDAITSSDANHQPFKEQGVSEGADPTTATEGQEVAAAGPTPATETPDIATQANEIVENGEKSIPAPRDPRRKSRLGMQSKTIMDGLKRRMSFLGKPRS